MTAPAADALEVMSYENVRTQKFVLELRAPVERYETRSAAGCKPGDARKDDLGQMLEKKFDELFGPGEED